MICKYISIGRNYKSWSSRLVWFLSSKGKLKKSSKGLPGGKGDLDPCALSLDGMVFTTLTLTTEGEVYSAKDEKFGKSFEFIPEKEKTVEEIKKNVK